MPPAEGGSISGPRMQGNGATSLIGPRGRGQQAKDCSMEDAIFSPRKRRLRRKQGMAARQDAWEEQKSVQGLVAADRWEVQN
jgi:hypothetical protein